MFLDRRGRRQRIAAAAALVAGSVAVAATLAQSRADIWWLGYSGGADNSRYFASRQIDKSNVARLQVAWTYPFGDTGSAPIVVRGVIYGRGRNGSLVALDAATGRELWVRENMTGMTSRGMNYWESADGRDQRLIFAMNSLLQEVDAKTGESIMSCGSSVVVDLRLGLDDRDPASIGNIQSSIPGEVFENLVIVGSATGEGYMSPPGDIRAYDVLTGKLAWTFHTVPRPGEFGYDTWPEGAHKYAGGANTWGDITLDRKNGIVFFPTGSPTHDLYGADCAGNNLCGNCLLALDARTGKRLWHFQTVHHDLWDYDLAAAPKLLTVRHNGTPVEIVAQAGKTGFLYVFERLTGKPIWPIEERAVPKSDVPGEVSSPTQPFPTKPAPFARQAFTPDDVNPFMSVEEQEKLRQAVRDTDHKGLFAPSSHLRYHIQFPGAWGGANWGSVAADPGTGMLFVRSLEMPSYRRMALSPERPGPPAIKGGQREQDGYAVYSQVCAACHGPG